MSNSVQASVMDTASLVENSSANPNTGHQTDHQTETNWEFNLLSWLWSTLPMR